MPIFEQEQLAYLRSLAKRGDAVARILADAFDSDSAAELHFFDPTLLPEIQAGLSAAVRYFASFGSDTIGSGSRGNPYKSIQRCIASIPPGCGGGDIKFVALDAGPFNAQVYIPDLRASGSVEGFTGLSIMFIGAGDADLIINPSTIPSPTFPANPSGGLKNRTFGYLGVGAHSVYGQGTHFVLGETDFLVNGFTVDGSRSPSGNVTVSSPAFELSQASFQSIKVIPFVSQLGDGFGLAVNMAPQSGVSVSFVGFTSAEANPVFSGSVGFQGCAFTSGSPVSLSVGGDGGGSGLIIDGYLTGGALFSGAVNSSVVIGGLTENFLKFTHRGLITGGMVCRGNIGSKVQVGDDFTTGGTPTCACSLAMDFEDGDTCFQVYGGKLTLGNASGICSVDNVQHFLNVDLDGFVYALFSGCVVGGTLDVPVTGSNGSKLFNFAGFGTTPLLHNISAPDDDIIVGSNAVAAFGSLPATDKAAALPQFVRAS